MVYLYANVVAIIVINFCPNIPLIRFILRAICKELMGRLVFYPPHNMLSSITRHLLHSGKSIRSHQDSPRMITDHLVSKQNFKLSRVVQVTLDLSVMIRHASHELTHKHRLLSLAHFLLC